MRAGSAADEAQTLYELIGNVLTMLEYIYMPTRENLHFRTCLHIL